jgi:hypothetical protein
MSGDDIKLEVKSEDSLRQNAELSEKLSEEMKTWFNGLVETQEKVEAEECEGGFCEGGLCEDANKWLKESRAARAAGAAGAPCEEGGRMCISENEEAKIRAKARDEPLRLGELRMEESRAASRGAASAAPRAASRGASSAVLAAIAVIEEKFKQFPTTPIKEVVSNNRVKVTGRAAAAPGHRKDLAEIINDPLLNAVYNHFIDVIINGKKVDFDRVAGGTSTIAFDGHNAIIALVNLYLQSCHVAPASILNIFGAVDLFLKMIQQLPKNSSCARILRIIIEVLEKFAVSTVLELQPQI